MKSSTNKHPEGGKPGVYTHLKDNLVLLIASPQIGKTGAILCFLEILDKHVTHHQHGALKVDPKSKEKEKEEKNEEAEGNSQSKWEKRVSADSEECWVNTVTGYTTWNKPTAVKAEEL